MDTNRPATPTATENAMMTATPTKTVSVGDRVVCNGYLGRVVDVCAWTTGMVEVRLDSGVVCVDVSATRPATASEIRKAERGNRVYIGQ